VNVRKIISLVAIFVCAIFMLFFGVRFRDKSVPRNGLEPDVSVELDFAGLYDAIRVIHDRTRAGNDEIARIFIGGNLEIRTFFEYLEGWLLDYDYAVAEVTSRISQLERTIIENEMASINHVLCVDFVDSWNSHYCCK